MKRNSGGGLVRKAEVKCSLNAATSMKSDICLGFKVNRLSSRPYSGCREGHQCPLSAVAGLQRFDRQGLVFKMHFRLYLK